MSIGKSLIVCTLAASLTVGVFTSVGGAATYTSSVTIQAGTNYFSLPAMSISLDPAVIFAGMPISNKLSYWCRQTQVWHVYPTDWAGESFMWHMGYRLEADQNYTISFQGTQPSSPRSTCLTPIQAGLAFISQPYECELSWSDFKLESSRNPGVKVSTPQAVANGWIEPYLLQDDPDSGIRVNLGDTVKPWHGYWVTSKVGPPQGDKLTIYWPDPRALTIQLLDNTRILLSWAIPGRTLQYADGALPALRTDAAWVDIDTNSIVDVGSKHYYTNTIGLSARWFQLR